MMESLVAFGKPLQGIQAQEHRPRRLKQLLVLNWRQKSAARSQLRLAIEDVLDTGLPRAYDKPLYEQKCSALFEHIYESYPERDTGIYAAAV
jgi:type I restriction enzyme R subunit